MSLPRRRGTATVGGVAEAAGEGGDGVALATAGVSPQRREKEQAVAMLAEELRRAAACVVVDYRGLRVAEEGELRRQMREAGVSYRVVKNTLMELAARDAGVDGLEETLRGPTAVAISRSDPAAAARLLAQFARDHPALQFKGGVVEGRVVGAAEVRALAELPSREVLLAQVAGGLAAPLALVAAVLAAPLRGLLGVTEQLARRGGAAAGAEG